MARIIALTDEARQIVAWALADYIKRSSEIPSWKTDRIELPRTARVLEIARGLLADVLRGDVYVSPPPEPAAATPPAPPPARRWFVRLWKP